MANAYPHLFQLLWQSTLPCYPLPSSSLDSVHMLRNCSWQVTYCWNLLFTAIRVKDIFLFGNLTPRRARRSTVRRSSLQWSLTRVCAALSTFTWIFGSPTTAGWFMKCRWRNKKEKWQNKRFIEKCSVVSFLISHRSNLEHLMLRKGKEWKWVQDWTGV